MTFKFASKPLIKSQLANPLSKSKDIPKKKIIDNNVH